MGRKRWSQDRPPESASRLPICWRGKERLSLSLAAPSSEFAIDLQVEMMQYGVTKTMQVALARGLAETTLGTAVTVNSGVAGPARSEGVEKCLIDMARTKNVTPEEIEKEFFHTARPGSLLQRFATTDEVAALVAFIASPLSSAINGAALRVEGGVVRSIF